jgi:hypothetical protein
LPKILHCCDRDDRLLFAVASVPAFTVTPPGLDKYAINALLPPWYQSILFAYYHFSYFSSLPFSALIVALPAYNQQISSGMAGVASQAWGKKKCDAKAQL